MRWWRRWKARCRYLDLERTALLWDVMLAAFAALVIIDSSGRVIFWNPAAERLFGWRSGDVLGTDLAETIIPHRYREAHRQGLVRMRAGEQERILCQDVAASALTRDGREIPVEFRVQKANSGGRMVFFGFLRDLTAQRQMEELHAQVTALRAEVEALRGREQG